MKSVLTALLLSISLIFSSGMTSYAQDFEKGVRAAQSGDFATAVKEWTALAEQGNAQAQFGLGVLYANGKGVAEDDKQAVKLYRKAAKQGLAQAQFNLGVLYANGQGVVKDNVYAHMWLSIAETNGGERAAKNRRKIVTKRMTSSQIAAAQKLAGECVVREYKGC
jgi:uncharacterized protein